MASETRWYVGHIENENRAEVFGDDRPIVTAESTGYDYIEGPFETEEQAKEAAS